MKNKELFDRTVAVLVQAYRNDVLDYTEPCGCAVGNICAAAAGYTVVTSSVTMEGGLAWKDTKGNHHFPNWPEVFMNGQFRDQKDYHGLAEIAKTGYTPEQLIQVERAFLQGWDLDIESGHDTQQFNGLLSVYDCLCEIHEVDKNEVTAGEEVFTR